MKTTKFLCAAAFAALTALVSCNKDPDIPEPLVKSFGFYASDNAGRIDSDCVGTVSGTEITVGVPPTTNLSELVARFTTNEGNIVSVGGVALISGQTVQDYSAPVSLKVEDEELKASVLYTVKVSLNPDSDPKLTSFKFELVNNLEAVGEDIEGEISGDAISVPMIKAADKTKLVATFTTTPTNVVKVGDAVQVSGETANDFTNPVDYIVSNSDGSKSALYSVSIRTVNGKLEPIVTYSERPVAGAVLRVDPFNKSPYIAFKEASVSGAESASADKLTVVNFVDGAWNVVGSAGFSNKVAKEHFDFDIDSKGGLYVAYADDEASPKGAKVVKFSDGSWSVVGSDAANNIDAQDLSLAAVSDNDVVLLQKNNGRKDPVFKRNYLVASLFNGSWKNEMILDITEMSAATVCKAGNVAYAVVVRRGGSVPFDVLKYSSGSWSSLRANFLREGATHTYTLFSNIAAKEDGTVYVLTADDARTNDEYRLVVERYSPTTQTWSVVGDYYPYVVNRSDKVEFAVAPDGTPYILYYDKANKKLNLTWLDSETKQWADPLVVATEPISDINIAFAASGVGYIAFTDANNAEKIFIYR